MKSKIKDFSERGGKILILLSLALYAPTLTMGIAERIFKLNGYTWHVLLLCLLSFIVAFLIFCKIFNKYVARLESKALQTAFLTPNEETLESKAKEASLKGVESKLDSTNKDFHSRAFIDSKRFFTSTKHNSIADSYSNPSLYRNDSTPYHALTKESQKRDSKNRDILTLPQYEPTSYHDKSLKTTQSQINKGYTLPISQAQYDNRKAQDDSISYQTKAKEAQKDSKNRQIYPLGIFYLFIFSLYGLLTMIINSEAQGWLLIYAFNPFAFAFIIGNILYLQKIKALFLILLFICLSAVCMFAMGYIGYFLSEYMP